VAAFKTADAAVHDEAFDVNGRGIQHLEHIGCPARRIRNRGAGRGEQRQTIEAVDRDVFTARACDVKDLWPLGPGVLKNLKCGADAG